MHLGMAGRFVLMKSLPPAAADSVRLRLRGTNHTADLIGPMRCALIDLAECNAIIAKLGPDVLRRDVQSNRIVTLTALEPQRTEADGRFYVYKRDRCLECGSPVRAWNLMGRTVYACMKCQR